MRTNKKSLIGQRTIIEKKVRPWTTLRNDKVPRSGWLKAVRGALGVTTRQLAERVGVRQSNITRLEEREPSGRVTLELLARAAEAMGCKLIYAIVPADGYSDLEAIIDERARTVAGELVRKTEHSMRLEKQGTEAVDRATQVTELTNDLKSKMDPRIWRTRPERGQKRDR